jgi:hypothetical protein
MARNFGTRVHVMFRKLLIGSVILLQSMLTAEIREIDRIDELILEVDPKTFVSRYR